MLGVTALLYMLGVWVRSSDQQASMPAQLPMPASWTTSVCQLKQVV